MGIKKNFSAPLASGLGATRRAAMLLLMMLLTTATAWAADVTLSGNESYTAQDGDVLTGSTSGTVTIASGAGITLSDVTITGGIVCAGTAEITLVGTNSVTGFSGYDSNIGANRYTAGIQVGGSGTTLTIKGNGSLTANGGNQSAGIGLSLAWNVTEDVVGGNIVIEGGTITATGGSGGAGIGAGVTKDTNNSSSRKAIVGNITITGGTVTAVGGSNADGIGAGQNDYNATIQIGTITIYDGINMVDASSIKDFASVVYMHGDDDVTASKTDYFTIIENGDRRIIVPKDDTDYTITIADGIEHGTLTVAAATAKYMETVTINATPDFGYTLVRFVVKDAQNNDVASTGNSFFMPKSNVTVSAEFEQGVHGTTEFAWSHGSPGLGWEEDASIYDGITTVYILNTEVSYSIQNYDYSTFFLDNSQENVYIPYAGGTGEFSEIGNVTSFCIPDNGQTGYYDITMTDVGNGKWGVSILPTVAQMDVVPDQTYTGSAITPEPLVIAGSLTLTKGTDYVYSYENNTNVGTATVRATFQDTYASLGYVEKTFTISAMRLPYVTVNVTGGGTVTVGDKSATDGQSFEVTTEKGADVTLTLTPESGNAVRSVEYRYTNSNGTTYFGDKLPVSGTTVTLTVPTDLKDGTGVTLTVTFAPALVGGADEASAVALTEATVTDLAGGWYKVESNVTFDHTLYLLGDTYLTIADGKTMTVNTASGKAIDSEYTLNVSGEGALNITTTEAYKIAVRVGSYVQTGATVTASGYIGIRCTDNFAGVTITNDFTFSGGQLTATRTGSGGHGIWANNNITLSCTNATDYIWASSYNLDGSGTLKISGTLCDEDGNIYSGTLSSDEKNAIGGKTLRPFKAITLADNADNSSAISEWNGGVAEVTLYGRTLSKSGEWNTLCLPFDVEDGDTSDGLSFSGTPLKGATVKELNAATSNLDNGTLTLNFTPANSIEAGKPYIVRWGTPEDNPGGTIVDPVFSGVTVSSTAPTAVNFTGGSFVGQYSPFSITADNIDEIILLSTGNRLGYSQNPRTLRSFRAHFEVPTSGGVREFVLNFDDENTTGIISPAEIKEITERAGAWYSLDGRKLDTKPTAKGVYIRGGKKVIIK